MFLTIASVLLLAMVPLCAGSCGTGGDRRFSGEIQEKLGKAVDATMAEYGVPGAIVGVWAPGRGEWLSTRGVSVVETGEKPKLADHTRIGSITKTFTATTVLILVDEGRLSLDDTVAKFDLGVTVPNQDRITVRNLLNMTSGLYNYTESDRFWLDFYADPTRPWTPEQLVEITAAQPPKAEPGQVYDYNNTNYFLLGMIIEKLTGKPAGEVITTSVIKKLGLENTEFPVKTSMPEPYLHGYTTTLSDPGTRDIKSLTDISIQTPTPWWTAGAMISTVDDLRTWLNALAKGTLLSPEMHEEQVKFSAPNTESYGLGVMNGRSVLGHSGEVPGYNSSAYTKKGGDGVTVIVFLNRYPSADEGVSDKALGAILKTLNESLQE